MAALGLPFVSPRPPSTCNPASGGVQPACPVTARLRYRLLHPVAGQRVNLVCRCQGPGRTVTIAQTDHNGRIAHVQTRWDYGTLGSTGLTFVVPRQQGTWVVDDQYCTGEPRTTLYTTPVARCPIIAPRLTFGCGTPLNVHTTVTCQLRGIGFYYNEPLSITYRVELRRAQDTQSTIYRRTGLADGAGACARPPFSFALDQRILSYKVTVTVRGAHGEQARIVAAGKP